MKHLLILVAALLLIPPAALDAADLELTESIQLAECHSLGWARNNSNQASQKTGAWVVDPVLWKQAVEKKGEGKKEDTTFALWLPDGIEYAKGIVVISGHGSGETLYKHPELRKLARELHLAIFKFIGNPMQRGFWPTSLLYERLKAFGEKSKHPELEHAPLFLYGHSNGTGFSAVFPSTESARVWAWVSMRPGTTQMVDQPRAAQVPGMVMFGEDDPFFAQPSREKNLAIVDTMRKEHGALWNYAVEPKTGHGPGEKSWPLVFSFLRHTWSARVPVDADPRKGPPTLATLKLENGYIGKNWSLPAGGYQTLPIAPYAKFTADKPTASWLVNESYANDWRAFQRDGQVGK